MALVVCLQVFMLEYWKRKQKRYNLEWGMDGKVARSAISITLLLCVRRSHLPIRLLGISPAFTAAFY